MADTNINGDKEVDIQNLDDDDITIPETQFNTHQQPAPLPIDLLNGHANELDAKRAVSKTPESQQLQQMQQQQQRQQQRWREQDGNKDKDVLPSSPPSPDAPPYYDWDDFEHRFEQALRAADEKEEGILKEAGELAQYFRAWASAASVHDDDRAVKRLQTRRRHVNIQEGQMEEKQKHYEEVVKAFESALALLQA